MSQRDNQPEVPLHAPVPLALRTHERQPVGVINPYALVEAILRKKIDWNDPGSTKLMSDVLQTDYHELFDPKYNSPLYAGFHLNKTTMRMERLEQSAIKIIDPSEQIIPDMSKVKTLGDLKGLGLKKLEDAAVLNALVENGKLKLTVKTPSLDKTTTNSTLPKQIASLVLPRIGLKKSGAEGSSDDWQPDGYAWKDMGDFFKDTTEYSDPVQGGVGNCWLIAAMSAVAWAKPFSIVHRNRATGTGEADRTNAITFYQKGGNHDAPTATVEVTDKTVVYDWGDYSPFCTSQDRGEIWPMVYEKAFAKWCTQNQGDCPNILETAGGYSDIAMAQLTDTTPYYYDTWSRTPDELWSIVRENSVAFKTVNPMTANTYSSGDQYYGSNIVACHAYTCLGWAMANGQKYIILRNPWGYTEPSGMGNTYDGLLTFFDTSFWRPIDMINSDGVFALEISAFKYYYAALCVAK